MLTAFKTVRSLVAVSWLLLLAAGCSQKQSPKEFTIAFSQCTTGPWRDVMLAEMKRELAFYPAIKLLYKQADGSTQTQIDQTRELLSQKPDLLIISPNEAEPLRPLVEEAFNRGTPVVVVDRKISSPLYSAYVGGDNYGVGKMAAEYSHNLLRGQGTVLEFMLLPGSSPAVERHKGLVDGLKAYPSMTLSASVNGEGLKDKESPQIDSVIRRYPNPDLVFAQNDFLALKVSGEFKRRNLPVPKIIGVDGLPGKGEGMELVSDGVIDATLLYPTGGEEAIRTALKILNKEEFTRDNTIQTTVIDSTNVRYMQLQAAKMSSQQSAIERQQTLLDDLKTLTANQRTFLYILVLSLALALSFGGVLFYLFRQNRRINRKLQAQNEEIKAQKKEIEDVSAQAQAANEARVAFFTNISHEFRTPLTLILAPLEELMGGTKNPQQSRNLSLVQKNVIRLLRLVNQLMDFRKIESGKMRLRASENDVVGFVSDIMQSYQSIAQKRNIDLRLLTSERALPLWFDVNMLDKVLFNLLSNAFKFTKDGGYIHLHLHKSADGKSVILKVEDNGVGMEPQAVENVFGVFYQGEYENQKGSGLGLALSKQLMALHSGTIAVQSGKWKGTTFTLYLPLGKDHLTADEIVETQVTPFIFYEDEKVYTTELETDYKAPTDTEPFKKEKEYTVLLIEDNADLRGFLKSRLEQQFEILEADNGQSALQQGFDCVPDLIVSDVVIPGKDGMALVNIFKNDVRTSHIPFILLTGKAAVEHQIEGMRSRADAYITKPFNVEFLEQTVQSLLANRATLKEHFTADISTKLKTQTAGKLDRKFATEFAAIVESNIANESFTVDDIGKEMGISRVQLYRKVKALLNINVNEYILNTRLQKAKYLLQHEELSISEIAYKVGFSSPAYFSTVFKSKFGVTPKGFREA